MIQGVQVEGLNRFARAMRKVDASFPARLRAGFNESARIVAEEARTSVPKKSGTLAGTIRASSTTRHARVSMGGARAPYAGFIEFGGHVGRNKSVHREYIAGGRYLFPAFKNKRTEVEVAMSAMVRRLIEGTNG